MRDYIEIRDNFENDTDEKNGIVSFFNPILAVIVRDGKGASVCTGGSELTMTHLPIIDKRSH